MKVRIFTKKLFFKIFVSPDQSPVLLSLKTSADARRWSFASSSGYGTNTPINTMETENSNSNHSLQYLSNDLLVYNKNASTSANRNSVSSSARPQLSLNEPSSSSLSSGAKKESLDCPVEIQLLNSPRTAAIKNEMSMFQFCHGSKRSRINSSNDSSQLDDSSEVGFSPSVSFTRQRARSLR